MKFGIEAVILVEIRLPSFSVTYYDQEVKDEQLKMILDLVEEIRNESLAREKSYKRTIAGITITESRTDNSN